MALTLYRRVWGKNCSPFEGVGLRAADLDDNSNPPRGKFNEPLLGDGSAAVRGLLELPCAIDAVQKLHDPA